MPPDPARAGPVPGARNRAPLAPVRKTDLVLSQGHHTLLRQFVLLPPRPGHPAAGLVVSLVVHAALALPFALPRPARATGEDPIERLVVFLLPPDEEQVPRAAAGPGIDWAGLPGNQGAVETPPPPSDTDPLLTAGRAGEADSVEPEPPGAAVELPIETALTEIEVDSMVERDPNSAAPVYPAEMLEKSVEGSTFVHYVVDTTGRVDTTTIRVIRSTHPAFTRSVRDALALMRFRPAIQSSRRVRQWVEQNFAFKILPRPPVDST